MAVEMSASGLHLQQLQEGMRPSVQLGLGALLTAG